MYTGFALCGPRWLNGHFAVPSQKPKVASESTCKSDSNHWVSHHKSSSVHEIEIVKEASLIFVDSPRQVPDWSLEESKVVSQSRTRGTSMLIGGVAKHSFAK